MADYYDIEPNGNGGYTVTPKDNPGCFSVIGVIIMVLIIGFFATRCDSGTSNSTTPTTEATRPVPTLNSTQNETIATNSAVEPAYLAYLHIMDETYSYCEDTEISDAYGNTYQGPYIALISVTTVTDPIEGYAAFVTNGDYEFFSGTYFTNADQEDAQLWFKIYADGILIYESDPISKTTGPVDFCVNISGARTVKVEATTEYYAEYIYLVDAIVYN